MGQAVGRRQRPRCMRPCCGMLLIARSVDDGQDDHPHPVHEVPVPGHHLHALGVRRPQRARPANTQQRPSMTSPTMTCEACRPTSGVEGAAEEIRADREPVTIDELVPLPRGAGQEDGAEHGRHREPPAGARMSPRAERARAERDRRRCWRRDRWCRPWAARARRSDTGRGGSSPCSRGRRPRRRANSEPSAMMSPIIPARPRHA